MHREQRKSLGLKKTLGLMKILVLELEGAAQEGLDESEPASSSKERCLNSQRVDRESLRINQNLVSEVNE